MQTIRVEKNLNKMGNRLPQPNYQEIKKKEGIKVTQVSRTETLETSLSVNSSQTSLMTDESKEYIDGQGINNWQQSLQGRLQQLEIPNPRTNAPAPNKAQYDCLQPIS